MLAKIGKQLEIKEISEWYKISAYDINKVGGKIITNKYKQFRKSAAKILQ